MSYKRRINKMSQHILIKGTYRNYKTNLIGVLNPQNNTGFMLEDYKELTNKFNTYIYYLK